MTKRNKKILLRLLILFLIIFYIYLKNVYFQDRGLPNAHTPDPASAYTRAPNHDGPAPPVLSCPSVGGELESVLSNQVTRIPLLNKNAATESLSPQTGSPDELLNEHISTLPDTISDLPQSGYYASVRPAPLPLPPGPVAGPPINSGAPVTSKPEEAISEDGVPKEDPPQETKSNPNQLPDEPVPEPVTILLMGSGLILARLYKRKRRTKTCIDYNSH